jgi:hypothetical protein
MRAADLVVGTAFRVGSSESIFPFRWLALPPGRQRELLDSNCVNAIIEK